MYAGRQTVSISYFFSFSIYNFIAVAEFLFFILIASKTESFTSESPLPKEYFLLE